MSNLKDKGIDDIVLLFSRHDDSIPAFFKGKYVETSPFDDELSYVDEKKVSKKYVEVIESVAHA